MKKKIKAQKKKKQKKGSQRQKVWSMAKIVRNWSLGLNIGQKATLEAVIRKKNIKAVIRKSI